MTTRHFARQTLVPLGLAVAGCCWLTAGQASIISAAPNAGFDDSAYTLNLAQNAASYTFSATGDFLSSSAIQTGGAGQVGTNAGTISTYGTGSLAPFIGPDLATTFTSYDSATSFFSPSTETYLALGLDLSDGEHYGYARVDTSDNTLISYGYQSTAGQGIRAGATAAVPAPAPSVLGMFGLGLAMLGVGAATRRRRRQFADGSMQGIAAAT